jgi:hypothetical protein
MMMFLVPLPTTEIEIMASHWSIHLRRSWLLFACCPGLGEVLQS